MSRKKFTANLGNLFGDDDADILSEESVLLATPTVVEKKRIQPSSRTSHGKNFASDLESFLKEAFEESFELQSQGGTQAAMMDAQIKKRSHRPASGLDLLIRSTLEPIAMTDEDARTRRVTLLFDQKKLEKLKTIARLERTYLKDIVDEIVQGFIRTYEKEKGNLK